MRARLATIRVTRATNAFFQCLEGVFHPGMANLFEALGVVCATTHPIKILWNNWMVVARQGKPIEWLIPIVTRIGPYCQTNLCLGAPHLDNIFDISDDNIRPRYKVRDFWAH